MVPGGDGQGRQSVLLQGDGSSGNAGDDQQCSRHTDEVGSAGRRVLGGAGTGTGAGGGAVAAGTYGGRSQRLIGHNNRTGQGAAEAQKTAVVVKLGVQVGQRAILTYHVGAVALGHAVHGQLRRAVYDDLLGAVAVGGLDGRTGTGQIVVQRLLGGGGKGGVVYGAEVDLVTGLQRNRNIDLAAVILGNRLDPAAGSNVLAVHGAAFTV